MTKPAKTPKSPKKPSPSSYGKPAKPANARAYFYGVHAVWALLNYRPDEAVALFVQLGDRSSQIEALLTTAQTFGLSIQAIAKDKLTELCGSTQHQGIAVLARPPKLADEVLLDELLAKPSVLFLVLDQITDAHNLGACLRTAAAMGVDAVILPKNHSAPITPAVAKVSVGASEMVPVIGVTNLARTLERLKTHGVFVFGTALDETATPSHRCDFGGKVAIVMGSEGDGMRRLTREMCDTLVYIPMSPHPDRPQSLNVSVATGMVLYEAARQRAFAN